MTEAAATPSPPSARPRSRTRRILGRTLRWGGLSLLVLAFLGSALLLWSSRRPFPQIDGEIEIRGLDGTIEIIRDEQGVPHIYADTAHDLLLAQGFVHAQDRFWQMDTWRHIGAGRLSEMFGEDQVEADAFIRTMGWYDLAQRQYDAEDATSRGFLDAYAEGVNAYLGMRSPSELAFEYTVLELINHDYDPEPWTPTDTLVWGKVMSWDLRGNVDAEIDRAMLLGATTPETVAALYPPYPDEAPLIVPHDGPRVEPSQLSAAPGVSNTGLRRVATNADLIDAITGGGADGLGSNSWVIAGERTATGMPILANDPHLGIRMPSIWYQVGLHCRQLTETCPFDVAGFSFAGVPGVIIGHNERIAWGFTNLGPDVMDLYVERVNPDNPNQYEVNGEWVDMEIRTEAIEVAGGEPVTVTSRATRHGPVVSDVFGRLDEFDAAGVELPTPYVVALRWTALEDVPALTKTVFGLNVARDWDDFREALSTFSVPAQNVVYADVEGNIGYQAPGLVPIRSGGDGRLPVPGWDDRFEWTGFVPYEEMPSLFNPPEGWIVTANNAVVDGTFPYLLTSDWNLGDRAARLAELVAGADNASLDDVAAWQLDTFNRAAERMRPLLAEMAPGALEPIEEEALRLLLDWDLRNDATSGGAAVFEAAWRRLLEQVTARLPADLEANGGARWSQSLASLPPDDPMWDDPDTGEVESRAATVRRSFETGVADIVDELGGDPADWAWGELHTATFDNETLGRSGVAPVEWLFNRGPFATSGGFDIVNATGWTPSEGFIVDWVPSMRMIVDLGDLERSRTVNTTGNSGHAYSSHYQDQIEAWRTGALFPMRWDRATIEADAEGTLILVPGVD